MKRIINFSTIVIAFACLSYSLSAQIKGNKNIMSKTIDINGLTDIEAAIYANITVDAQGEDKMTITTDENILPLIDTEIVDGRMVLRQKEWIESSKGIQISISTSSLNKIQQSVHEDIKVFNLSQEKLSAIAILGSIELQGVVKVLRASGESGDIIALKLKVDKVNTNFWEDGRLVLNEVNEINGILKGESKIHYRGSNTKVNVKTKDDSEVRNLETPYEHKNPNAKWIDIKIKNNSSRRIQAYVKGPKPNGKNFSYGFPMNAGQVRKERWTVGTKVYKTGPLGTKKILVELTASDENQVVNLY